MVYTVTFNPAIDYVVQADDITVGSVNRTRSEKIYFGGKGINVSMVLAELGVKSKALGFVAGFTGEAIEKGVLKSGIEADFVRLEKGFSRINVKIKSECETELNGQGPIIGDNALNELFARVFAEVCIVVSLFVAFKLICRNFFKAIVGLCGVIFGNGAVDVVLLLFYIVVFFRRHYALYCSDVFHVLLFRGAF